MNPDLVLEVPDTPDSKILDNRCKHNSRLSLKQRRENLNLNKNKRKAVEIIPNLNNSDSDSNSISNSEFIILRGQGKGVVIQEGVVPNRASNKGKEIIDLASDNNINNNNNDINSPIELTRRRVGPRWLVRNGCISPCNIAKRNEEIKLREKDKNSVANNKGKEIDLSEMKGVSENNEQESVIREIIAGDLHHGMAKSHRACLVTNTERDSTNTNPANNQGWRTTQNHRTEPTNEIVPPGFHPIPSTSHNIRMQIRTRGKRIKLNTYHSGESSSSGRAHDPEILNLNLNSNNSNVIDLESTSLPGFSESSERKRQLERDELIAHQLQEQFYNESPVVLRTEEIDARLAMSLQQEENARSLVAAVGRRYSNNSSRVSRRGPTNPYPSSVPRLNIAVQHMQHDFNENDYETLLALDEDNFRHTGASQRQIDNLPLSVLQSDNFEEPCSVCLEKPSVGDKIRHLPCLHKFHKDCIDQWLQRRKECPICKCGIS